MMDDRGCWEWLGGLAHNGYGQIGLAKGAGSPIRAHRYSYELHFGAISEGLLVLHRCDNRSCVNPTHLWLGTVTDNARDAWKKGRGVSNLPKDQVFVRDPVTGRYVRLAKPDSKTTLQPG